MAASRRASPAAVTHRRVVPIKRADGEPLTRVDIQYAFLHDVFDNNQEVFTDPYAANAGEKKLCFRDLYVKAILHSTKASKGLKDKMNQSPTFTLDFAMLSLLVNVGRVNTTMSCKSLSHWTLSQKWRFAQSFLKWRPPSVHITLSQACKGRMGICKMLLELSISSKQVSSKTKRRMRLLRQRTYSPFLWAILCPLRSKKMTTEILTEI